MAKLKTVNKWKANQTNTIPFAGKVTFDENACIEVDENLVESLINIMPEFSLVGKPLEEDKGEDIKEKTEDTKPLEEDKEEDIKPQVQVDSNEVREKLNKLSVKEIKEDYLSQFPEEDTKDLKNKAEYIDYIVNQLV